MRSSTLLLAAAALALGGGLARADHEAPLWSSPPKRKGPGPSLADLVERFCAQNVNGELTFTGDEASAATLDERIDRHISELRDAELTHLPEDRAVLISLHDRLEQRKMRRMRREFYASATEAQLADLVLESLDDEIEDKAKLA